MKPKKLEKKLRLNKKTVTNLNLDEMKKLNGGNGGVTSPRSECPECVH